MWRMVHRFRLPFVLSVALTVSPSMAQPQPHVDANAGATSAIDAGVWAPGAQRPMTPEETARRAKVALKVGAQTVTVGELEDRLLEIPPFQIQTLGASKDEIVKAYVNQVLVRDLVLSAGAEQKKLGDQYPAKHQVQRAKSTATLRALRATFKSASAIPMEDVTKYYEENRSKFDSPERVNLWRILCKSKEEAENVHAAAKKDLTIPKFNDLARDHSVDKATYLRGGNLGFIAPDGSSNEAGLKVDVALVRGVASVKDGELAPAPIAEGSNWAVVWRRTTVPATKRSLDAATAQIRTTLFRERTEAAEKKLIDDLRAKNVSNYNADPLKIIEFPALDAGLGMPRSIPSSGTKN